MLVREVVLRIDDGFQALERAQRFVEFMVSAPSPFKPLGHHDELVVLGFHIVKVSDVALRDHEFAAPVEYAL